MKTLGRILLAVLTCIMVCSCGVSQIKNIKLVSAGVKYIIPTSTKNFDAMLELGIDNPAMAFNVSEVDGVIYVDAVPFATFTAGELVVGARKSLLYELPCTITLEPNISLLDVLKLSMRRSLDGIKADINLNVSSKNGRLSVPLNYKNMDFSEFSK